LFKSTPRERDALAVAAHFGVDVKALMSPRMDGGDTAVIDSLTIPDNEEGLRTFITDPNNAKRVFANQANAARFGQRYAEAYAKAHPEHAREVLDGTTKVTADQAAPQAVDGQAYREAFKILQNLIGSDNGLAKLAATNLNPLTRAADPRDVDPSLRSSFGWNPDAPAAQINGQVGTRAEFFIAAGARSHQVPQQFRANRSRIEQIRDAYSGTVPADGGFLVPEQFRAELLRLSLDTALVRGRARTIPMSSLKLKIPMIDSSTNVGSVHGGMIAYWTEESAQLIESQARFASVLLEAQKLTGYSAIPNELLADAPGFDALIMSMWPEALAFFEDLAFIRGSGAGEPLGFLTNAATVVQAAVSGQGANTITSSNIFSMYARMLPGSLNRAVWVVSPNALPQLFKLAAGDSSPIFISNIVAGVPLTILGRPVLVSEKVRTLGSQGDIAFVDLGYYLIGDRQVMQVADSGDYRFGYDQTAFRIISRVDGRPWLNSAITPANGGDTLSPFVELNASRT
jgi:HK97 family phage major capsid protein